MLMVKKQAGFGHLFIILAIVVLAAIGLTAVKVMSHNNKTAGSPQSAASQPQASQSSSNCSITPTLQTPVNLSKVSSILYPGQYRGNQYKAHGGFRFDGYKPSDITVKAPLDAQIERASRYNESGEVQILFEFTGACGWAYRFDHILTVAPALKSLVDSLPAPTGESSTTKITQQVTVKTGETIATAVGFTANNNTFVDFGVYNTKQKNMASQDPAWAAKHTQFPNDQYGVCWFDMLPAADAAKVKSLPAADGVSGKTSDYCQ